MEKSVRVCATGNSKTPASELLVKSVEQWGNKFKGHLHQLKTGSKYFYVFTID